jgi:hypothetical protein
MFNKETIKIYVPALETFGLFFGRSPTLQYNATQYHFFSFTFFFFTFFSFSFFFFFFFFPSSSSFVHTHLYSIEHKLNLSLSSFSPSLLFWCFWQLQSLLFLVSLLTPLYLYLLMYPFYVTCLPLAPTPPLLSLTILVC